MQPYINPNYYNQYQPSYMSQYNNPYSYQQQLQPQQQTLVNPVPSSQGFVGRMVNNFDEIVANDVPMDGRSAVFLKNDLSEIQVRSWSNDGRIQPITYKPILDQNGVQTENLSNNPQNVKIDLSDASTEVLMQRFDDIANRLDVLEQSFNRPTRGRQKKEADLDE